MINNVTSSSSSDYETTHKFKNCFGENIDAKFNVFIKLICDLIVEVDNEMFKNRTQKTTLVLCSFQQLLNLKLDRLSLKQLECEMDCTTYPDK